MKEILSALFPFLWNKNKGEQKKEPQKVRVEKTNEELMAEEDNAIKQKKTRCPYCGAENSMVIARSSNTKRIMVTTNYVMTKTKVDSKHICSLDENAVVGLYMKNCRECGFVAYFNKEKIDNKGEL